MGQAFDREQQDESGGPVGSTEPEGSVLERPGQRQPEHQAAEGDREHAQPSAHRVDLVQVRVHRAADPHPEDRDEHDQGTADTEPRMIVVHQLRRRGDGEDENEIEEQLEPGDAFHGWLTLWLGSAAQEASKRRFSYDGVPGSAVQTMICRSGSAAQVTAFQSRCRSPTTGCRRCLVPVSRVATS